MHPHTLPAPGFFWSSLFSLSLAVSLFVFFFFLKKNPSLPAAASFGPFAYIRFAILFFVCSFSHTANPHGQKQEARNRKQKTTTIERAHRKRTASPPTVPDPEISSKRKKQKRQDDYRNNILLRGVYHPHWHHYWRHYLLWKTGHHQLPQEVEKRWTCCCWRSSGATVAVWLKKEETRRTQQGTRRRREERKQTTTITPSSPSRYHANKFQAPRMDKSNATRLQDETERETERERHTHIASSRNRQHPASNHRGQQLKTQQGWIASNGAKKKEWLTRHTCPTPPSSSRRKTSPQLPGSADS